MDNLNDNEDINRARENFIKRIKTSAKESLFLFEMKQQKLRFNKEYLRFLDQRQQAKMQWLQVPNRNNVDNLNNIKPESLVNISGKKKKKYLKAKIDELQTNSKTKNVRDLYRNISDFKKGYQPRINMVKDEKGDLFTDSHSILARSRNHFSQLFSIQGVNTRWFKYDRD